MSEDVCVFIIHKFSLYNDRLKLKHVKYNPQCDMRCPFGHTSDALHCLGSTGRLRPVCAGGREIVAMILVKENSLCHRKASVGLGD